MKIYPKNRNIHRPPHLFIDDTFYFITTKTFNRIKIFKNDRYKKIFIQVLQQAVIKYQVRLISWVILNDHYHLQFKLSIGDELSKFIQNLHANSSRLINKEDNSLGRKVWYQYQDHGIRDDADFWKHFNYIHHNPIKHKYAKNM